jgi:hypothetical protein
MEQSTLNDGINHPPSGAFATAVVHLLHNAAAFAVVSLRQPPRQLLAYLVLGA